MLSHDDVQIPCMNCSKKVPMGDLRAHTSGKGWICIQCYNRQHGRPEIIEELQKPQRTFGKTYSSAVEKREETRSGVSLRYKCLRCKYEFLNKFLPQRCPYCAQAGSIEKVPSAHEIIVEVNEKAGWYD